MLSALATGIVTFLLPDLAIRPMIVVWFLFICPGMIVVRFLRLREGMTEWALAIALSITLDALIASIQLYTRLWSPGATCGMLILFCLVGGTIQLVADYINSGAVRSGL